MLLDGQLLAHPFFSPAADRNKEVILLELQRLLPAHGVALEIASGTGRHIAWFAKAFPGWLWTPSDMHACEFATIVAHTTAAGLCNVRVPHVLDVLSHSWQESPLTDLEDARFDVIYCANMLHIAPLAACAALMQGAAKRLTPKGQLVLYGPYLEEDGAASKGNVAFDASLRSSNPDWGLRRREEVELAARQAGLWLQKQVNMPSNNLLLVFGPAPA